MSRFNGWSKRNNGIESFALQRFAIKLSLPTRRSKVTLSKGQKWSRLRSSVFAIPEIQPDERLPLQPIASNALQSRVGRIERAVYHRVDRFAKALVFETHALRERTKQLDIGPA